MLLDLPEPFSEREYCYALYNRLGSQAKAILEDHNSELILPVIVIAEACWMIEHGKTSIPTVQDLLSVLDADPRVTIIFFDSEHPRQNFASDRDYRNA